MIDESRKNEIKEKSISLGKEMLLREIKYYRLHHSI